MRASAVIAAVLTVATAGWMLSGQLDGPSAPAPTTVAASQDEPLPGSGCSG